MFIDLTLPYSMWVVEAATPNSSAPSTPLPGQTSHTRSHSNAASTTALFSPPPASGALLSHVNSAPVTTAHSAPITIAHPSAANPPHLMTNVPQANPPFQAHSSTPSVSASALPGQHISGRLSGVVSLTDVLNLFAKATGLHPEDPEEMRRRRRGSSSSSRSGVRPSMESVRRDSLSVEVPGARR